MYHKFYGQILHIAYLGLFQSPLKLNNPEILMTENLHCCICNDDDACEHVKLVCNHTFHKKCMDQWANSIRNDFPTCPLCRERIATDTGGWCALSTAYITTGKITDPYVERCFKEKPFLEYPLLGSPTSATTTYKVSLTTGSIGWIDIENTKSEYGFMLNDAYIPFEIIKCGTFKIV
jgi:hypothetical protein